MRGFREMKRRHDDTHWPYWSSCHRQYVPRSKKSIDNRKNYLVEEEGKVSFLGKFHDDEQAKEFATKFGYKNFSIREAVEGEGK